MKHWLSAALVFVGLFVCGNQQASANHDVIIQCDIPYYMAQHRDSVAPQEKMQIRIVLESWAAEAQKTPVNIHLPDELIPLGKYENWQIVKQETGYMLQSEAKFQGGYGQWLDLVAVQVSPTAVAGTYSIRVTAGGQEKKYDVRIGAQLPSTDAAEVVLLKVSLPLDKDGKKDERLNANTIILRDKQWDRFRNFLRGKGASNQEAEAMHPLIHMGIEIANPSGEQTPVVLISRLLDYNTRHEVPGLVTPSSTGEDLLTGGEMVDAEGSKSFVVLTGEKTQQILLPLYTDERLATGGEYWLQTLINDGNSERILAETGITIVKKNMGAVTAVCIAAIAVIGGIGLGFFRLRSTLKKMKTRWLITIALFGTTTFACVNVPSTLLGDFFHIVLGPFGFLITGIFSGVFLYMLLISLFTLIPRSGVISLVMMMRMLLGMLAFGHITLISLLSYGLQALGLEIAVYHFCHNTKAVESLQQAKMVWRDTLLLALACGVADSVTTYINMQSTIVLYRLYYATWYIYLVMAFNGMIYTMIGVFCGSAMGRQLQKIKGA